MNVVVLLTVDGTIQDTGGASHLFGTEGYNHQLFPTTIRTSKNG